MGWRVKRANRPQVSAEEKFRRSRLGAGVGDKYRMMSYALLLAYAGEFERARDLLARLARTAPGDRDVATAIINVQQLSGDFSPAQWRDPRRLARARAPWPDWPLWDGSPLAPGTTLLLWDLDARPGRAGRPREFGLGDLVQLARMAAPVKAASQAARLILQVPPALVPLLRTLPGPDAVVDHLPPDGLGVQVPLMLAPAFVPLTPALLQAAPYLHAAPETIARWAPTFADRHGVHIGLHFAAEPRHQSARERSIPLQALAPLFDMPGTRWYSLQRGAAADVAPFPLIDLGDIDTEPFRETAGVLPHLDLLIACDSSVAHVAGALDACPVWLLLPFYFDARWGAASEATPWYPRHRLFQQDFPGDWDSLIAQVKDELATAIRQGTLPRRRSAPAPRPHP